MIAIMLDPLTSALQGLAGKPIVLTDGHPLFAKDAAVVSLFLLTEGCANLVRYGINGETVILQRAAAPAIISEASLYVDRYHCGAIAASLVTVLPIPRHRLQSRLRQDATLSELWAQHLAKEIQRNRFSWKT